MDMNGQHHAPAAFNLQGKSPRYALDKWADGPQIRSGRGGKEKEIPSFPLPRIGPRSSSP